MTDDSATGVPFTEASKGSVDEWSREVFEALRTWSAARHGTWTRWEPGYLLLEIVRFERHEIEPVAIDTADEELTVTFGYWETHLPEPLGTGDADAAETARQAQDLVENWLSGHLKTAVFTDETGKWRGSRLVEGEDLLPQLNPDWVRGFGPTQVEVRTLRRADWRRFSIDGDMILEVA